MKELDYYLEIYKCIYTVFYRNYLASYVWMRYSNISICETWGIWDFPNVYAWFFYDSLVNEAWTAEKKIATTKIINSWDMSISDVSIMEWIISLIIVIVIYYIFILIPDSF